MQTQFQYMNLYRIASFLMVFSSILPTSLLGQNFNEIDKLIQQREEDRYYDTEVYHVRDLQSNLDLYERLVLLQGMNLVPPTQGMNLVNPITGQPTRKLAASADPQTRPEWVKEFDKYALSNNPLRSLNEATPQTFKPSEVNYDRFNNSPAKEKLGYYPHKVGTDGYNDQLKRYQRNETKYIAKQYVLPIFIGLTVLLMFLYRTKILLALKSRERINLHEENYSRVKYVNVSREQPRSSIEELKEEIETLKILKHEGIIDESEYNERKKILKQKY